MSAGLTFLDNGESCPINERPSGRQACKACPYFVAWRLRRMDGPEGREYLRSTVSCAYRSDALTWLETAAIVPHPMGA